MAIIIASKIDSALTEQEKIFIRSKVIECKLETKLCAVEEDLRQALKEANIDASTSLSNLAAKFMDAKLLKRIHSLFS